MYLYDFGNEKIIIEWVDNLVSINDREYTMNILLTNLNIILFRNIKKDSILAAREIHEMPEYDVVIKIALNDLKYERIRLEQAKENINVNLKLPKYTSYILNEIVRNSKANYPHVVGQMTELSKQTKEKKY